MAEAKEADSVVSEECIQELLEFFSKGSYKAKNSDRRNEIIQKMCLHLIARDYNVEVIDNKSGQLCGHYPSELIVIESARTDSHSPGHSCRRVNDTAQLKELISTARYARCRSRFVIPVILFNDKNICRSATLSTMAEMYGRAGMDWFTGGETASSTSERDSANVQSPSLEPSSASPTADKNEMEMMTRVRGQDVQLLKAVGVELICDLMVEKKKSKYGLLVASSEKVDKWARYCDFQIASMPYPGCEFFREYHDKKFNPVNLHFDWSQSMIDAELLIPETLRLQLTHIPFKSYQEWDLVQMTLNYLKLFLTYIQHGNGGLLVHCISGWDRTPLFICLLRLSLWADDRAHSSLSAKEILYFTLAYDWFTFGHPFRDRHEKGEEIMFFCFDFLKYMTSDELSVNRTPELGGSSQGEMSHNGRPSTSTSGSRSTTAGVAASRAQQLTSSTHSHCRCELEESWIVESLTHETKNNHFSDGALSENWHHVSQEAGDLHNSSSSWSHHSSLHHSGSSNRSYANCSLSSVPENHSHSPHSHSGSTRRDKLLAVRTIFQRVYRTAVPEAQPQGAMAFATGLLSRLPLFGNNYTSV